jgi:transposase
MFTELFFHTTWFNNKCSCLSGNSKETQGGYTAQEPRTVDQWTWSSSFHDNARPHSAAATVNPLNSWGWEIFPHPPCSPDLAPSDFHVLPKMKKHPRSQRFHSSEDVQNEVNVPRTHFFYEGLDKLIYR